MNRVIEAIVLTGGASRRMGQDKSDLEFEGMALGEKTAHAILNAGYPVTILGKAPIQDFPFLLDEQVHAGPLSALAQFRPSADCVFVASCDMPRFDPKIVRTLSSIIKSRPSAEAAVPFLKESLQPTCALYASTAWEHIPAVLRSGKRSLMAWLEAMEVVLVLEDDLAENGIDPTSFEGANTPEDLARILGRP